MLAEPQHFATLGKPLNEGDTLTYSSEVWTTDGSKRKKRLEVLLATDTEGINIFDVSPVVPIMTIAYGL